MIRLGNWLKHTKGAKTINYLIVPGEVNGKKVKGVDDFFAAGGTIDGLRAAATTTQPNPHAARDTFTDARLAETIADDVLQDHFIWVSGLGWLRWDGNRWANATDVEVIETARVYVLDRFRQELDTGAHDKTALDGWKSMCSASRIRTVVGLARGIVEHKVNELDADPDLLNTPSGVVDLMTGGVMPHDPEFLITKVTSGKYRPRFGHLDWMKALEALPEEEPSGYEW
jgi:hypothetical protein